ncbi:MAG: type II toxin-antitoxin system RelE/ParE family toxin [Candidatus Kapabacteria bacterium]|nr:type II toxin-antitoxin system RelE/ParE family toxin [Candidatus Kapabacteria bacterium]
MNNNKFILRFTRTALKSLKTIPANSAKLIISNLEKLAEDPYSMINVKKLTNYGVSYRLRVGKYRVLYEIEKDNQISIILIVDILDRKDAYK